jgi:dTDP-4-dehydrorhamnose reductase
MKILILGGQGNLGSQLVKFFSADFEIISWDREDFDVLDFPLLKANINELKPGLIINTVAYNAVDKCEDIEEHVLAKRLNIDLPAVLAELAFNLRSILINYSTDYVFSGTEHKREFRENETPNPVNKYGETKSAGEREVIKWIERGLNAYIIRTSKLFGPKGTSSLSKPSFFEIMLTMAATKPEVSVVNEELSCFTYTPDLAIATKRLWELEMPSGVYHLVNEGPVTWLDGAQLLFELKRIDVLIKPLRSENLMRAARRPKFSVLKNTKIKKLRPFYEALKEYLNSTNL